MRVERTRPKPRSIEEGGSSRCISSSSSSSSGGEERKHLFVWKTPVSAIATAFLAQLLDAEGGRRHEYFRAAVSGEVEDDDLT